MAHNGDGIMPYEEGLKMRTRAGAIAVILGAVLFIVGLVQAITDDSHSDVKATTTATQEGYLWTEPGVLDLINTKVHIEAKSAEKDTPVTVAVGFSEDVTAWTEGLPGLSVTKLADWTTFETVPHEAQVEDRPAVAGSDQWIHEEPGTGTVSFDYEVTAPGATSIIARAGDGSTPTLTLKWERPSGGSHPVAVAVIGALIGLLGAVLLLMGRKDPHNFAALMATLTTATKTGAQKVKAAVAKIASARPRGNESKSDELADEADKTTDINAEEAESEAAAHVDKKAETEAQESTSEGTTGTSKAARTGRHKAVESGKVSLFARDFDED